MDARSLLLCSQELGNEVSLLLLPDVSADSGETNPQAEAPSDPIAPELWDHYKSLYTHLSFIQ